MNPNPLDKKELIKSASYCLSCGQCNQVCPTHEIEIFSPMAVTHDLQAGKIDQAITDRHIFNCLCCNKCNTLCPMHTTKSGVDFANIIRNLREYASKNKLVLKDKASSPGHTCVLHEIPEGQINDSELPVVDVLQYFVKEPKLKIAKQGEVAYFVGCLPVLNEKYGDFGVDYDQIPKAVVKILNKLGINPVVLNMKCCGHDDLWAGRRDVYESLAKYNLAQFKAAGVKTIITACAEGYRTWKFDYPKLDPTYKFEVYHIAEYLNKVQAWKSLDFKSISKTKVTYQDPCRLGRVGDGIYAPPRQLLSKLPNVQLIEMESNKENALCCGCGIYLPENPEVWKMWSKRLKEAQTTKADYLLTACPKCATHFNYTLLNNPDEKATQNLPRVMDWAVFVANYLV